MEAKNDKKKSGTGVDLGKVMNWLDEQRFRIGDAQYEAALHQFVQVMTAHLDFLVNYVEASERAAARNAIQAFLKHLHDKIPELVIRDEHHAELIWLTDLQAALNTYIETTISDDENIEESAQSDDGIYVIVADNDVPFQLPKREFVDDGGPLVFEQYVKTADLESIKKRAAYLGDKYGRLRIARLEFIDQ